MTRLCPLFLAAFLLVPAARAEASASVSEAPAPPALAVLPFESNEAARDVAPAVAALLASRLAESSALKVLSQRELDAVLGAGHPLLGDSASCAEGRCHEELSRLAGARYVLTGRVERSAEGYLVTASLVDAVQGKPLARPRAEAADTESLLGDIGTVAEELLTRLAPSELDDGVGEVVVGLRLNNSFISRLASLNPGVDLELGYAFHPEWVGFIQVGINFVRSNGEGSEGGLSVLPSQVGLRHYHRIEHALRPYWGFGLGVQLSFGDFGIFQSTGPLPSISGFFGAEYRLGQLGIQLEAGTNVAQAVLGLAGDGLGKGINIDLNLGLSYRF